MHLLAKDILEGAVQQMGRAVVAHDRPAPLGVDLGRDLRAHAQVALEHLAVVDDQAGHRALGIDAPGKSPSRLPISPVSPTWPPVSA